ncbi:Adenine deaminase [Lachnospiraceae bacterium KHCPX20]|nr:Adenine deaminase [Lachnospiraceae bacterium KHCPX20]
MTKDELKKRIDVAMHRRPADLVIRHVNVVNVYTCEILERDIAICGDTIAAVGENYEGEKEIDAKGLFALPGLIESHIHIESSMLTPEEFGRLLLLRGTTTAVCDPHEIVNVCGMQGFDYMRRAARRSPLDMKFMIPSCVPSTPFEHSGAQVLADDMDAYIHEDDVPGLGEMMNAYGVYNGQEDILEKIAMAQSNGKVVDGHSPGIVGDELIGYLSAGIRTDHECYTADEMRERLQQGMYVMLRYGSACHELSHLLKNVSENNARRCVLCSDDRQAATLLRNGDLDELLRICVREGIAPITAVQMATLNAAECYGFNDRGAIAPSKRADIVLVSDLTSFAVKKVVVAGKLVVEDGVYLPELSRESISSVAGRMHVKGEVSEHLKMQLNYRKLSEIQGMNRTHYPEHTAGIARVHCIGMQPGSILSKDEIRDVAVDGDGNFIYDPAMDVAKMVVMERHNGLGTAGKAFVCGYGINRGAIASSIAHDSHNLLVVGTNDRDMEIAAKRLIEVGGGVCLAGDGEVIAELALPVAGLMSDKSGEEVSDALKQLEDIAKLHLGINSKLEPVMSLAFMALPVVPDLKLTDMGLYSVTEGSFISVEVEPEVQ